MTTLNRILEIQVWKLEIINRKNKLLPKKSKNNLSSRRSESAGL